MPRPRARTKSAVDLRKAEPPPSSDPDPFYRLADAAVDGGQPLHDREIDHLLYDVTAGYATR